MTDEPEPGIIRDPERQEWVVDEEHGFAYDAQRFPEETFGCEECGHEIESYWTGDRNADYCPKCQLAVGFSTTPTAEKDPHPEIDGVDVELVGRSTYVHDGEPYQRAYWVGTCWDCGEAVYSNGKRHVCLGWFPQTDYDCEWSIQIDD